MDCGRQTVDRQLGFEHHAAACGWRQLGRGSLERSSCCARVWAAPPAATMPAAAAQPVAVLAAAVQ